jgi:manganese transport protein
VELPAPTDARWTAPSYRRILLPLDHTAGDADAIAHAAALAKAHGSALDVLHVEEDVTSVVYGAMASTAEVESGRDYLTSVVEALRAQGVVAEMHVRYSKSPRDEIVKVARELRPDLIVMGAHGHRGIKDIVLGTTINAVRHELDIPILVVRK